MNSRAVFTLSIMLLVCAGLLWSGMEAYGQGEIPIEDIDSVPIEFSAQEALILGVGVLGGLTIAYLGYREAKAKDPKITFSGTRFFDRIILATLVSVPLAIGAAADLVSINLFSLWMVYGTSLGTAEVIMRLRGKHKPTPGI